MLNVSKATNENPVIVTVKSVEAEAIVWYQTTHVSIEVPSVAEIVNKYMHYVANENTMRLAISDCGSMYRFTPFIDLTDLDDREVPTEEVPKYLTDFIEALGSEGMDHLSIALVYDPEKEKEKQYIQATSAYGLDKEQLIVSCMKFNVMLTELTHELIKSTTPSETLKLFDIMENEGLPIPDEMKECIRLLESFK